MTHSAHSACACQWSCMHIEHGAHRGDGAQYAPRSRRPRGVGLRRLWAAAAVLRERSKFAEGIEVHAHARTVRREADHAAFASEHVTRLEVGGRFVPGFEEPILTPVLRHGEQRLVDPHRLVDRIGIAEQVLPRGLGRSVAASFPNVEMRGDGFFGRKDREPGGNGSSVGSWANRVSASTNTAVS